MKYEDPFLDEHVRIFGAICVTFAVGWLTLLILVLNGVV